MSDKILAVIGHVDHGKTALVKALTGIETDRLKEEQARGLSIALGFAYLTSDDHICHLVDTPGHADFVRTTASGLSGADTVLLVVSAPDSVAVQTRDYVKMAGLFGVEQAVVALTKSDLATSAQMHEAKYAAEALLAKNGIRVSAIVECSAVTGRGIEILRSNLRTIKVSTSNRERPRVTYLPVDRVFTAPGLGTIVTGSLMGGGLSSEREVRVEPAGLKGTVRGLQVTGREQTSVDVGNRVAVNLRGIEAGQIRTGDVLCEAGAPPSSEILDVALECASNESPGLRHMEQVQVLIGTRAISGKVRLLTPADTQEGVAPRIGQLELAAPYLAYRGQRAVLRRPGTSELIAGALVLDPAATKVTRNKPAHIEVLRAAYDQSPVRLANALANRDRGCVRLEELERLSGQSIDAIRQDLETSFGFDDGSYAFEKAARTALENRCLEALDRLHAERPIRPFVPLQDLRTALGGVPEPLVQAARSALEDRGELQVRGASVGLTKRVSLEHLPSEATVRIEAANAALRARGLAPENHETGSVEDPDVADIEEHLIWMGQAMRLQNVGLNQSILLHSDAINDALEYLRAAFGEAQSFTTSEARERLETNRKIIVPLLEYFDQIGATERKGNLRRIMACPRSVEG